MSTWLALSDIHGNQLILEKILAEVPSIDGILLLGDITHKGGYKEAQSLFSLFPLFFLKKLEVFAIFGNMDDKGVAEYLTEKGKNLHGRGVVYKDIGFCGLGGSSHTPFSTPTEYSEKEILDLLQQGYEAISSAPLKILLSHVPPYGTTIDRAGLGFHAGSKALKSFLENTKLDLCLCGHIHESFGETKVGKTLCYNIGAAKDGRYALLEIDGKDFKVSLKQSNV